MSAIIILFVLFITYINIEFLYTRNKILIAKHRLIAYDNYLPIVNELIEEVSDSIVNNDKTYSIFKLNLHLLSGLLIAKYRHVTMLKYNLVFDIKNYYLRSIVQVADYNGEITIYNETIDNATYLVFHVEI